MTSLSGTVRSLWQKQEAAKAVRRVLGVIRVGNQLQTRIPNEELRDDTDPEQLWFELDALAFRAVVDQQFLGGDSGVDRARRGMLNRLRSVATSPVALPDGEAAGPPESHAP